MPASRIASFTAAATFSTIAGRPMSSGSSTALIAVPITSRAFEAGPVLSLRAKTVACGVMTPSQPPDHTIGIWLTAFSSRLPCLSNTRRKAWSARMRVKSLTPPFPSVLPMTPMTSSALNSPLVMPFSRPEASDTDFNSTLRTSIAIVFLPYVGAAHPSRMPRNSLPATYRRFRHQASAMHSISTFIPKLNCTPQVVRAGGSFGKNLRYTAFMFSNSSMS